jgi:glycerate kinase
MRVLIAFDKFKDSMSARTACDMAAGAIAATAKGFQVDPCPLSDGGEGFAGILTRAAGGSENTVEATGPRGDPVLASFGIVSVGKIPARARALLQGAADETGVIAVVEMATASGLALLAPERRDPMLASSVGTGQVILAAASSGVQAVLLGVGGSATHDLGLGALGALGLSFLESGGGTLEALVPADWPLVQGIAGRVAAGFPPILIACDVDNPLLGPMGALATYGPQKGLKEYDAAMLESESTRLAAMVCREFAQHSELASLPGAGAAGGIAFGLMAAAGARLLPGFELVSSWLDLDRRVAEADIVITGEGRFDDSSLSGKGPGALAHRALELGKRVHVFAGEIRLSGKIPGLSTHAITPAGVPLAEALANAPALLFIAVKRALSHG